MANGQLSKGEQHLCRNQCGDQRWHNRYDGVSSITTSSHVDNNGVLEVQTGRFDVGAAATGSGIDGSVANSNTALVGTTGA
jgi:hypothetical protein